MDSEKPRLPDAQTRKAKRAFVKAVKSKDFLLANQIAMAVAEELFKRDPVLARSVTWERFYSRLTATGIQYQSYDFEAVDYQLYEIDGIKRLLRGPKPDLDGAPGRYITFLGAAQMFGRHQRRPPHVIISETFGVPCVNLCVSGAGPEYFCSEKILQIANGGIAAVVQVMSGRSVGCDEYPGGDKTAPKGTDEKIKRLNLLGRIWRQSNEEAIRLTKKWQANYVACMTRLLDLISVPTVLAWVSTRAPNEWSIAQMRESGDFGKFPQLVDENMVHQISAHCTEFVSVTRDEGLPHGFVSRFSGEKCPIFKPNGKPSWENKYYCSAVAGQQLSLQIEAALRDMRLEF